MKIVISGMPGEGKTTMARAIERALREAGISSSLHDTHEDEFAPRLVHPPLHRIARPELHVDIVTKTTVRPTCHKPRKKKP
jgi:cytidylate kinase